jgi:putative peptide maturation system protein
MSEPTDRVMLDVLAYLDALASQQPGAAAAQARLPQLRARHPQAQIELVWDEQSFDGSLHFDALVRAEPGKTVSLSVCPDRALPWPLRGLQKWKESDLLRVNGTTLGVADAIGQLDVLWRSGPGMQRLVDSCLIDEALEQHAIEVGEAEVQLAADAMRRARGLHSRAATEAWMRDTGATWQTLQALATGLARLAELRERVVGPLVEDHLADHRSDYDRVHLATVKTPSQPLADRIAQQVRSDRVALLQAAQRAFADDPDSPLETALQRQRRCRLDADVAAALQAAELTAAPRGVDAGPSLIGPLIAGSDALLVQVLSVEAAEAGEGMRRAALLRLFDDWLAQRRQTARVEWYWGRADDGYARRTATP